MKKYLVLIIFLSAVLRLAYLGSIPGGFFRDESAIAYNAYSIWKTGADEFGVRFPLVFRSFEVFFLPLYIYISAPIIGILGLSEFSARLLSGISGVAGVYLAYLIAKEIWNEKAGLFASFVLAVSPWHIFYSRGAFEGNFALTLFAVGFYLWLKFLKNSGVKYLFFSGLAFALSMYSYQAERLVIPLFAVVAVMTCFKKLWQIRLNLILPCLIIFAVLIPLLSLSFKPGGYHRAFGVSVFSQEKLPPGWVEGRPAGIFVNNYIYLRTREVTSLYLSYFSPKNLFTDGDYNLQRSVVGFSAFYAFGIIGLVVGFWNLLKRRNQSSDLLFAWILLGPIPAALTGDPFHTYRSLLLFFPISVLMGYGFSKLKHHIFFVLIFLASLFVFLFNYFFVTQIERAHDWDWGYKHIVNYVMTLPKGTHVVVDDPWTESYIHFLFFGKIDPLDYQKAVAKLGDPKNYYYVSSDKIRPAGFYNYEFRKVDWPKERGNTGTVFVMWSERLPDSEFKGDPKVQLLKQIYYPDGTAAFKIVKII